MPEPQPKNNQSTASGFPLHWFTSDHAKMPHRPPAISTEHKSSQILKQTPEDLRAQLAPPGVVQVGFDRPTSASNDAAQSTQGSSPFQGPLYLGYHTGCVPGYGPGSPSRSYPGLDQTPLDNGPIYIGPGGVPFRRTEPGGGRSVEITGKKRQPKEEDAIRTQWGDDDRVGHYPALSNSDSLPGVNRTSKQ